MLFSQRKDLSFPFKIQSIPQGLWNENGRNNPTRKHLTKSIMRGKISFPLISFCDSTCEV